MAVYTKLMQHQKDIVGFIKDLQYFGVFADYGTGKTLTALKFVDINKLNKVLVVSSKTAITGTWPEEIAKHTDFKFVQILATTPKKKVEILYKGLLYANEPETPYGRSMRNTVIFLVNFDGVGNIFNELLDAGFDAIFVDESTRIKSHDARRTIILWKLANYIPIRGILSGFPVTEDLRNIYSQIKFLDAGEALGNNYYKFVNKYFVKTSPVKSTPRRKGVKEILEKIKPFCIRVTNETLDLPPKSYKIIKVPPTAKQKKIMKELNEFFMVECGRVKLNVEYVFTLIAKSLQICNGFIKDNEGNHEIIPTNKDNALMDLLEDIDVSKNKALIWCHHKFVVKKLSKILTKFGIKHLTLTGDTPDISRVVSKFQNSKNYNIILATQKKASESITLTKAKYAIYYSNSWSYDERGNSEARCYRKGSEIHDHIMYIDLIVENTIEQNVLDCLRNKKNLVQSLKKEFGGLKA